MKHAGLLFRKPSGICLSLLSVIAFTLTACGGTAAGPTSTATGHAVEPATPVEQAMQSPLEPPLQSPLPTPVATIDWDSPPSPGKASLRGRIVLANPAVLLGELFLAKAIPSSDPEIYVLELDEKSSPRALLDRTTGDFLFVDIEPGKYGLIVWEPMASGPVNDPETGETLFVDLAADQRADLGSLTYP